MIARRDLIFGGACVVAAGAAYQLKPRKKQTLLGTQKMASVVPTAFGSWVSQTADNIVQAETQGKLAALLYSETVARVYENIATGDEIMMLIAYGDTQSDLLQLHRPEACYPAVGFRLTMSEPSTVPVGYAAIPSRRVVAERSDRRERIVYWTRLGEYLPGDAGEQREARLLTAMKGFIPDGALFRFSSLRDSDAAFEDLDGFVSSMVLSVAATNRAALIGSNLAAKVAA